MISVSTNRSGYGRCAICSLTLQMNMKDWPFGASNSPNGMGDNPVFLTDLPKPFKRDLSEKTLAMLEHARELTHGQVFMILRDFVGDRSALRSRAKQLLCVIIEGMFLSLAQRQKVRKGKRSGNR